MLLASNTTYEKRTGRLFERASIMGSAFSAHLPCPTPQPLWYRQLMTVLFSQLIVIIDQIFHINIAFFL